MSKLSKWVDRKSGYILTFPLVLIIVLFSILPILLTLQYSFFDMQLNDRSRNDTYLKPYVNLSLNQETIDYLHFYLNYDMGYVQNEETIAKIDEI
ncbi:MAG: sugar ABC transporter permease, partial [Clostridiaceae bacterium]|nr:sugar ABC transporter permease [Clostridiaceae bacterium]